MEMMSESFANFSRKANPLKIRMIAMRRPIKTQHLTMKKHGICENQFSKTSKSCKINALGFKETSDLCQMTSSKSFIQDCCRSLSFG